MSGKWLVFADKLPTDKWCWRDCQKCGKRFAAITSMVKQGRLKFCSFPCSSTKGISRPKVDVAERFWAKVDKTSECWTWTAATFGPGRYGCFVAIIRGIKTTSAHRASYLLSVGDIPIGMEVCHRCDNPPCVRPEHLFLGTRKDNAMDSSKKGRTNFQNSTNHCSKKTHCPQGHPYSGYNLVMKKVHGKPARLCRICSNASRLRSWRSQRARLALSRTGSNCAGPSLPEINQSTAMQPAAHKSKT